MVLLTVQVDDAWKNIRSPGDSNCTITANNRQLSIFENPINNYYERSKNDCLNWKGALDFFKIPSQLCSLTVVGYGKK